MTLTSLPATHHRPAPIQIHLYDPLLIVQSIFIPPPSTQLSRRKSCMAQSRSDVVSTTAFEPHERIFTSPSFGSTCAPASCRTLTGGGRFFVPSVPNIGHHFWRLFDGYSMRYDHYDGVLFENDPHRAAWRNGCRLRLEFGINRI